MSYELNRQLAARRDPLPTTASVDAVTASIIRGAMETICIEAATHLGRAASSAIINSSNERNGAIVDGHGRLAGAAIGTPHLSFVTQMEVAYGISRAKDYDWGPGDVFLANDPDHGGGHLPDYCVYAPVYSDEGELILVQCLQAHQGDTGGKTPGGFTLDATDVFTEGVTFPCLKLVHRGVLRQDVFDMVARNNRQATFPGDLAAMIGGVQLSAVALGDMIRKFTPDVVKASVNYNIDHTERRVREEVASWPDGSYAATVYVDADTTGVPDVKVHVTCRVEGDKLTVDLTGTDDRQHLVGVWNTFSNSRSYVMTQVVAMMDPSINKNEGFFNAIDLIIPEGSIAQPPPNKPAALGSFHPACEITEAVCVALSEVVPGRAQPQVYKMGTPNQLVGYLDGGEIWVEPGVDSRSHDSSAVQGIDGWGSCPSALGNLMLAQAEDAETRFPIVSVSREMTIDHEGPGQWRGMPGTLAVKQLLQPAMAVAWMTTQKHPLRGMCGGEDAAPYGNTFNVGTPEEYKVGLTDNTTLKAGAVIAYQYGGGAGFGSPLLRDPEAVREDVLDEYISIRRAHEKYGVVLTGSVEDFDLAVDHAATEALRRAMGVEALRKEAAQ